MLTTPLQRGQNSLIKILGIILFMPIFMEFENVFLKQFFSVETSTITLIIYVIVEIAIFSVLIRLKEIRIKDFAYYLLIMSLFLFSFIIFKETREYFLTPTMMIIYFFYLPIGIFCLTKIHCWNSFCKKLLPMALLAILVSLVILLFFEYQKYLSYMEFSYALLPFVCLLYWAFREQKKLRYLILSLLGYVEILIFGARAPIIYVFLFVILFEFFRKDKPLSYKIPLASLLFIIFTVLFFYGEFIIDALSNFSLFSESRFFVKISQNELFESTTRDLIYQQCQSRIFSMGLDISGFFGDRAYCGSVYPHNIVYELLMSWGWFLGSLFVLFLIYKIFKGIMNPETCIVTIFLFMSLFGRYFVSGSYLIEGAFWIFGSLLVAINRKQLSQKVSTSQRRKL